MRRCLPYQAERETAAGEPYPAIDAAEKKMVALLASHQVYTERSLCKSSVKLTLLSLDAPRTRMCPAATVQLAASLERSAFGNQNRVKTDG